MKKIYFSLLVLTMMMVSTIAKAQYTVNVTSDPEDNYFSGYQAFDPTEIATALGTDTAALHQLISTGGAVYIKTASGGKSNEYTGNVNEFWMNAEGLAQGYSQDGSCWYAGISYDAGGEVDEETGEVSKPEVAVAMGQMPKFFKKVYTDTDLKTTFYLVNGEKEISFDITLHVNAAVKATLPDPVTTLSALTIVANYEFPIDFVTGKSYEGKTFSTTLEGIYDALGVTADALDENIADYIYTPVMKADSIDGEAVYSWTDNLAIPEEAAGGAWFGRYINFNEATEEEIIVGNAPKDWNTGANTFYTQSFTLEEGKFSLTTGQFPDVMKAGDTDYANLYIIMGDKAACVKVYANVTDPEIIDPNQMTQVGETTISVTANVDDNYATKGFTIDMEAVVGALGCTTDDLEDVYSWAAEGELSDNHTEGSGGFYFNEEGFISSWGSTSAFFIARTDNSLADGKFTIGQMAGHFTDLEGEKTVKAQLIFKNGANYYAVNVEYTVKGKEQKPEEFTYNLIGTESLSIQIVPSADTYAWETKTAVDVEYISSKIGTDDFVLYTDKANADGKLEWSNKYTCTPAPGFWYGTTTYENEEHQVVVDNAGWGTNSFGITYADGEITWYQFPGQRAAGDSFMANLYVVNEQTGDYLQYALYVKYVDEVVPEAEIKATEEVSFLITEDLKDEDGYYVVSIDMTAAYDTLGISDELIEACSVIAPKSQTIYETTSTEESLFYTVDGYVVSEEDESAIFSASVVVNEEGKPVIMIDDFSEFFNQDSASAILRIGLEYDGQRYLHIIKLANYIQQPIINVKDITDLIEKYLEQPEDGDITVKDITDLIDQYLQQ